MERTMNDNFLSLNDYLEDRRKVIMSVWAGTGIGKSYFALTAPKPIYFFSLEPDGPYWSLKTALDNEVINTENVFVDEVIRSALKDRDVPLVRTIVEDAVIYKYMKTAIEDVVYDKGNKGGTIVIDTGTTWNQFIQAIEMEDIMRKRKSQGKDTPFPFDYGVANKSMKSSIDAIRNSNLNCVITHHSSIKYNSKGERTNIEEYSGSTQLVKWVDLQLQLRYSPETKQRYAIVDKCRINMEKIGEEIDDPTFSSVLDAVGV